ncbi:hypothetical protein [Sporosarcina ureilytica]|uniref:hypothetical protein n=1 Tax=Sporosarcina ureilytica TaxID=298596 RepID=UPI0012DB27CC|nr:hypothetical protein [Sporosarcina ureilytica]
MLLKFSGIDIEVTGLIGVYTNSGTYKWHDGVKDVPNKKSRVQNRGFSVLITVY